MRSHLSWLAKVAVAMCMSAMSCGIAPTTRREVRDERTENGFSVRVLEYTYLPPEHDEAGKWGSRRTWTEYEVRAPEAPKSVIGATAYAIKADGSLCVAILAESRDIVIIGPEGILARKPCPTFDSSVAVLGGWRYASPEIAFSNVDAIELTYHKYELEPTSSQNSQSHGRDDMKLVASRSITWSWRKGDIQDVPEHSAPPGDQKR